ncbi:MAG: DUF4215 domain-containing protein, partial [Deltaproteobacteria bacterium]|nr:DUF4215 domain-containing protein [Deltaproteobacteria bacterium]
MIQNFVSSAACRSCLPLLASSLLLFACNRTPDVSLQVVDNTQDKRISALLGEGVEFGFLEDDLETDGEEDTDNYQWVLLQTDSPETDRITVVRPGASSTVPHPGYWVIARSEGGEILGRGYQRIPFSNSEKAVATVYILDWCGNSDNKGKVCATDDNERTICAPTDPTGSLACSASSCGDGVWDASGESPEACDISDTDSYSAIPDGSSCNSACELFTPFCGDGVVDKPVEECDDGNQDNTDSCTNDCSIARCGDAIVQQGEEDCDDANTSNTDACTNTCKSARCGDGFLREADENGENGEECEDGDIDDYDNCTSTCELNDCGDGYINFNNDLEECDDEQETEDCNTDCTLSYCGDSIVNTTAGEVCDPGAINAETAECDYDCTVQICGDGVVNSTAGEECDTGAVGEETAECNNNCTASDCGDGIVNTAAGEACDTFVETADCNANCTVNSCGDGFVNSSAGEECDYGEPGADPGECTINCKLSVCGDAVVHLAAGEECDPGTEDLETANCTYNCTFTSCGDGIVTLAAGEECDPGSGPAGTPGSGPIATAECNLDCTFSSCGDGIVNALDGEECDDGNDNNNDSCTNSCLDARCGDGYINLDDELEQCDDNNTSELDSCNNNCQITTCGDGIIQTMFNEVCDDGNDSDNDDCTSTCDNNVCGDGLVNLLNNAEACDDVSESAGCNADCTLAICGDGIINEAANEECDDSGESSVCNSNCSISECGDAIINTTSGEECDDEVESALCNEDCSAQECGDGYTNTEAGEECDDANTINTDACTDACQNATCGDGIVHENVEDCDDANTDETDTCSSSCQATYCGDGITQAVLNETCDDGNDSNLDACKANCSANTCGDGFVNLEGNAEQCDDQNSNQNDDCLGTCVLNTCGDGIIKNSTEPSLYQGTLPLTPLEDCDDNNTNPNDGCDACISQAWNPTTLFGTQTALNESPFSRVGDIEFDLADNMYVIDSGRDQIFKVSGATDLNPTGEIALLAGSSSNNENMKFYVSSQEGGNILFSGDGDGEPAKYTALNEPSNVKTDGLGNVYFVEEENRTTGYSDDWFNESSTLRKLNDEGVLSTVIQFSNSGSYSPSQNVDYTLYKIRDIAVDGSGVLYILTEIEIRSTTGCDTGSGCQTDSSYNQAILIQDPNAIDQSFTGTLISSSGYFYPRHIDIALDGTIMVATYNQVYALEVSNSPMAPSGVISTGNITYDTMESYTATGIIGTFEICDDTGMMPGAPPCTPTIGDTGNNVYLSYISSLEKDLDGDLYVGIGMEFSSDPSEISNNTNIYKFTKGTDSAWSFTQKKTYTWGFTSEAMPFASSSDNGFYSATTTGKGVRRDTNAGTEDVINATGNSANLCGQGKANALELNRPLQSVFDSSTNSYFVLDNGERRIYRVDLTNNERYEFAGTGEECSDISPYSCGDGYQASQLSFYYPESIAFDSTNSYLYVADNSRIRKIQLANDDSLANGCDAAGDGLVSSTVIGGNSCDSGCSIDGVDGASASLSYNIHMALDANQNLYFTSGNNIYRVNKNAGLGIEKTAFINMVVGCPTGATCQSDIFSNPLALNLSEPSEIAFDTSGNLWIADRINYRILRFNPNTNQIVKVAGAASACNSGDCGNGGNALTANLGEVTALQTMSDGSVLIAENIAQVSFGAGDSEPLYLSTIRRISADGSGGFIIQAEAGRNTEPENGNIGDFESPSEAAFSEIQDIQEAQKDSGGDYIGDYEWLAIDQKLNLIRGVTHTSPYKIQSVAGGVKWSDDCATDPVECSPTFGRPVSIQKVSSDYWILDSEAGRIRAYSEETSPYRVDNVLGYPGFNYSSCSELGCADPATLSSQVAKYHPTLTDALGMVYDAVTESVYFTQQQEAPSTFYASSSSYGSSIHCIANPLADDASVIFFAGSADGTGYSNGTALNSRFNKPAGMAVHWETASVGYLYIADSGNHIIRRLQLDPSAPCKAAGNDVELVAGTPGAKAFL